MGTIKEKPKFTPILSANDIEAGDLFVIPGEPGTKRPRLHLSPKTLGSLGLYYPTTKANRGAVDTIFGNRDTVTLAVFTKTDKYLSVDDRRAAQRANVVITPDKAPLKVAYFCPLHTKLALDMYKDVLIKRLEDAGMSMHHFITDDWTPALVENSTTVQIPSIIRPSYSTTSMCDAHRPVMTPGECRTVANDLASQIPYHRPLYADRRFWDEMTARGAKVLRPANESARNMVLKSIMDNRLRLVPGEIRRFYDKTKATVEALQRETRTLRKIIAWWTKFAEYTNEEREAVARGVYEAADIKNEGAYTLC